MRKLIVFFALAPLTLFAYELGMLEMEVPTPLEQFNLQFFLDHRFGDATDRPFGTFFGFYSGINALQELKFIPIKGLEIGANRRSRQSEWTLGASYSLRVPKIYLRGRLGAEFFSYQDITQPERPMNFFFSATLQSEPILKRVKPILTIGYDLYNQKLGSGAGLSAIIFTNVWYFEEIALLGEYYPVFGRSAERPWLGDYNVWIAGLGFSTPGHQFLFSVGNTFDEGARRLMLGSDSEGLHIGLAIKRKFKF